MRKLIMLVAILALTLLLPASVMAQNTGNGTLAVTATVQSSIYLTLENANGGATLTDTGTNAATLDLGMVSAFGGSIPSGVTKALVGPATAPTAFTLTTSFGVRVAEFNAGGSAGYTLTAALNAADATNTWTVDGQNLNTTAQNVTGGTGYGAIVNHNFVLTIPTTAAAGAISNTINFTATAS